jgi:hypothetical protein
MMPNPSEVDTTSAQRQQDASLHQAAWPDMLSSLHVAYGDLTRTQLEVVGRIIRANRAAGALLECELATLAGKLFADICPTADVPTTPWRLLVRASNGVLTEAT